MKKLLLLLLATLSVVILSATGLVLNRDSNQMQFLTLHSTNQVADINNQIAVVTVTETFINNHNTLFDARYYFPIQEGASPTQLRWFWENEWHTAIIAGSPSNPQGGPSNIPAYFTNYVGAFPVVFDFNANLLPEDSLTVEISYVQMLPYEYGNVSLNLINNYSVIQQSPVISQTFDVSLVSDRTIQSFLTPNFTSTITHSEHHATATAYIPELMADTDFRVVYSLAQDSLAFTALSGMFDAPDNLGDGFFTFIAEPDDDSADYVEKVFTLIIDRSGSMSGNKIVQARDAARYIVNNLNEGDKFNLISFSTNVTPLWDTHQIFTMETKQQALDFINAISAYGSTNISGAFGTAIPQFVGSDPDVANIILFFTDGVPTVGHIDTTTLLNYVQEIIMLNEVYPCVFNFGIGSDVNTQLLMNLAVNNDGFAQFLGNDELESSITSFYDSIRYPVMLSPTFTVSPAGAISEVYPYPLPNVYKGHQLIVSGRYNQAQPIEITFSGNLYGNTVSFPYSTVLSEDTPEGMDFLPKVWAKQKIESLIVQYYLLYENSAEAIALRNQIVNLSIAYGVVCEFTSFTGGETSNEDMVNQDSQVSPAIKLLGNYPNPFNPSTTIRFEVKDDVSGPVFIKIYNQKGQLVRTLGLHVNHRGMYEIVWDGMDQSGKTVGSGLYFYTLNFDKYLLSGKMTMLK